MQYCSRCGNWVCDSTYTPTNVPVMDRYTCAFCGFELPAGEDGIEYNICPGCHSNMFEEENN